MGTGGDQLERSRALLSLRIAVPLSGFVLVALERLHERSPSHDLIGGGVHSASLLGAALAIVALCAALGRAHRATVGALEEQVATGPGEPAAHGNSSRGSAAAEG